MSARYELSDLRAANDHAAKRRRRLDPWRKRTGARKQRRDRIRLLALLTGTGVLR